MCQKHKKYKNRIKIMTSVKICNNKIYILFICYLKQICSYKGYTYQNMQMLQVISLDSLNIKEYNLRKPLIQNSFNMTIF